MHVRSPFGGGGTSRLTNIAPHRSFVQRVAGPYHGVDELVKTSQGCPEHVETGPGVPSLKVPWERDQYQDETQE